ncbi:MAG: roadblock/LC7 domain-containing protein [Anaerolineae bacterium]|nr:roadblock/LC7 domain-containing protein [Anaerolineae bacterium]
MIDERRTELLTRCLWSLQEASTAVEGLLLSHVDGLLLTSTFYGDESTQRLAAITTALYLLSEQVSMASKYGESSEVFLKLSEGKPRHEADIPAVRYVYIHPVGVDAILVVVCRRDAMPDNFSRYLLRAVRYLDMVLDGDTPSLPHWTG